MSASTVTAQQATPRQSAAATPYTRRARFFDSGNAFNIVYPEIPGAAFVAERDQALDPATGTKLILCDQSKALELDYPATSPLVLAAYARVRAGDSLTLEPRASVVLCYVIEGAGRVTLGKDIIEFGCGDVFSLPGGQPIVIDSDSADDSVLWVVTNEPELRFERLLPPPPEEALIEPTHFPASSIVDGLVHARDRLSGQRVAGLALVFASERLEAKRNISPSFTLAMNQLGPGEDQIAHSHNSVAVSLAISHDRCYSLVNGEKKDWQPFVTMVTPPTSVHSHHNRSDGLANWLIVQDGGLYAHCRTMGFEFEDQPVHR